jgi:hypothetical protein
MNARNVLRMARLQVFQNINEFDARGCVSELDNCMQNEFVCGNNFKNCLDPSGKFIVNGQLVPGSTPGSVNDASTGAGLYATWKFGTSTPPNNPWGPATDGNTLGSLIGQISQMTFNTTHNRFDAAGGGGEMLVFMLNRIGVIDQNGNPHGMCANVMNRCQNITRTTGSGQNKTYTPSNVVVTEFLSRALMQIKAGQDNILSTHAANCAQEVRMCLQQNNAMSGWGTSNTSQLHNMTMNACRAQATTCMSVGEGADTGTSGVNDYMQKLWTTMAGTENTISYNFVPGFSWKEDIRPTVKFVYEPATDQGWVIPFKSNTVGDSNFTVATPTGCTAPTIVSWHTDANCDSAAVTVSTNGPTIKSVILPPTTKTEGPINLYMKADFAAGTNCSLYGTWCGSKKQ